MGHGTRHRTAGFTLMELLVVVIIVGILATLALPQFPRAMERARQAEARLILGQIYQAERAYFDEQNTYTGVTTELVATTIPPAASPDHYFAYSLASGSATDFTATATRKSGTATGRPPNWSSGYTITVDQTGAYATTGF